ncbi:hypothetical protein T439DRAFT_384227 [Meredithblackwellia eburnea MCA 4105]
MNIEFQDDASRAYSSDEEDQARPPLVERDLTPPKLKLREISDLRVQSSYLSFFDTEYRKGTIESRHFGSLLIKAADLQPSWKVQLAVLDHLVKAAELRLGSNASPGKDLLQLQIRYIDYLQKGTLVFGPFDKDRPSSHRVKLANYWRENGVKLPELQWGEGPSRCEQVQIKTLQEWIQTMKIICDDLGVSASDLTIRTKGTTVSLHFLAEFFSDNGWEQHHMQKEDLVFRGMSWQRAIDKSLSCIKLLQEECFEKGKIFFKLDNQSGFEHIYKLHIQSRLVNLVNPTTRVTVTSSNSLGRGRMTPRQERLYRQVGACF